MPQVPNWLRIGVVCTVTCVWAANFTASLILADYKPDPLVHAAFMSVIGYLLVGERRGGGGEQ